VYDLGHLRLYLMILHRSPIPLIEIEKRKLNSSLEAGTIDGDTVESILDWKNKLGLQSADESEYRYLLRDLTVVADRALEPDVDLALPLGGDGPPIGRFVSPSSKARMFYLTEKGEMLYNQAIEDRPSYESSLFWLILRNQRYLPLIQQVILNPNSYRAGDIGELVQTSDSVSKNCALQWLRYFGIIKTENQLNVELLARFLLAAAILEINNYLERGLTYYVKEIDRYLNEVFSLSPSATNFVSALDIIFQHSGKSVIEGYTSGRGDAYLPNHPNISIVKLGGKIEVSVASDANPAEVIRITRYAVER
jgi:hypothetical protein